MSTMRLLGLGSFLGLAVLPQISLGQGPVPSTLAPSGFQRVVATDQTFSLLLPAEWTVREATAEGFFAWSPYGESLASGKAVIFADQRSAALALQTLQSNGYPPQQLMMLGKLVSPPLAPVDVIRVFLPRYAGGAIRGLQVLAAQERPGPAGVHGAEIHYRYLLTPSVGDPSFRATLPPSLLNQSAIQMEAITNIQTLGPLLGGIGIQYWVFSYQTAEAPVLVFQRRAALYMAIGRTVQLNQAAIQGRVDAQNPNPGLDPNRLRRLAEAPLYDPARVDLNRSLDLTSAQLGNGFPHTSPQYPGQIWTLPQISPSANYWLCPGGVVKQGEVNPGGCTALKP